MNIVNEIIKLRGMMGRLIPFELNETSIDQEERTYAGRLVKYKYVTHHTRNSQGEIRASPSRAS